MKEQPTIRRLSKTDLEEILISNPAFNSRTIGETTRRTKEYRTNIKYERMQRIGSEAKTAGNSTKNNRRNYINFNSIGKKALLLTTLSFVTFHALVYDIPITRKLFSQYIRASNRVTQNYNKRASDKTWNEIFEQTKKRVYELNAFVYRKVGVSDLYSKINQLSENSHFRLSASELNNTALKEAYIKVMGYYFDKYNPKLSGLEERVVDDCFKNQIDPAFVFGMFYNESLVGTRGISALNNNPLNIRGQGTAGSRFGFANFNNMAEGFEKALKILRKHYINDTIKEALTYWAPPNENDTRRYIEGVVWAMGKFLERLYSQIVYGTPEITGNTK